MGIATGFPLISESYSQAYIHRIYIWMSLDMFLCNEGGHPLDQAWLNSVLIPVRERSIDVRSFVKKNCPEMCLSACRANPPEHTRFRELLPSRLEDYSHLRLFERSAHLFSQFVGAKGGVKMDSTAFRAFTRLRIRMYTNELCNKEDAESLRRINHLLHIVAILCVAATCTSNT